LEPLQTKRSTRWWSKHYLIDWVSSGAVGLICILATSFMTPYKRFHEESSDSTLAYPLQNDIIPTWLLLVISLLVPIATYATFLLLKYSNYHEFHHIMLTKWIVLLLTDSITQILKVMAGRDRPNYYNNIISNGTNADASESFPSGHASFSFAAMTTLTLYLCGKLKVFNSNVGHSGTMFWKSTFAFSPLLVSLFIAVSRTMDYHHNFDDVCAGAIIGSVIAYIHYSIYFYPITGKYCGVPKKYGNNLQTLSEHENTSPVADETV